MRITSRNTRLLDHGNRRFHNPSNCVIPKLLNCDKTYDLPNFLVLNARSVAGKVDELRCINDQHEFQIICITETWLSEAIPNEIIGLSDYDIIRCDRTGEKGGGVAVYVHRNLPYRIRRDLSSSKFECIRLTIQPRSLPRSISRLVVACIYLPPSLSQDEIELAYDYLASSYDKLTTESPDSGFVITGDFNPKSN